LIIIAVEKEMRTKIGIAIFLHEPEKKEKKLK
jgi:hypothetical protein